MRLLIQQVISASVNIKEKNIDRNIGKGIIVYLGISTDDLIDYKEKIARIIKKIPLLKCLTGDDGNINVCLEDIKGEVLLISNFTLYGRSLKGTKLDFIHSAPYKEAEKIYNYFISEAQKAGWRIETGEFGADMIVDSINEGPLNYVLDY